MITLKTLAQATEQEVFDQIARHLLQQGKRSEEEKLCRYREGNLKCAAGCLIGDDEYSEQMEGNKWTTLVYDGKVPAKHKKLILTLQLMHDSKNPQEWKECLDELAENWNFNTSCLEE